MATLRRVKFPPPWTLTSLPQRFLRAGTTTSSPPRTQSRFFIAEAPRCRACVRPFHPPLATRNAHRSSCCEAQSSPPTLMMKGARYSTKSRSSSPASSEPPPPTDGPSPRPPQEQPQDNKQQGPEEDQRPDHDDASSTLVLPSPRSAQQAAAAADLGPHDTITLDVSSAGGSTVKLDALGPLVVNADGSVGRVANWQAMTGHEREMTVRMVTRRNRQRLEVLQKKAQD